MLLLDYKTALETSASRSPACWPRSMYRRDIADYLGLTLETISRVLSLLQDEGALAFSGARQIALPDRRRLAAVNR